MDMTFLEISLESYIKCLKNVQALCRCNNSNVRDLAQGHHFTRRFYPQRRSLYASLEQGRADSVREPPSSSTCFRRSHRWESLTPSAFLGKEGAGDTSTVLSPDSLYLGEPCASQVGADG